MTNRGQSDQRGEFIVAICERGEVLQSSSSTGHISQSLPAEDRFWFARRCIFLIAAWLILLSVLIVLFRAKHPFGSSDYTCLQSAQSIGKNEAAALDLAFYDRNNHHKPTGRVYVGTISSICGNAGLFKTAAYKKIRITDCRIVVYGYETETSQRDQQQFLSELKVTKNQLEQQIRSLQNAFLFSDPAITVPWLALGNTAELRIYGFEFRSFREDNPKLLVSCHRALLSCLSPKLLFLEGHVILRTDEKTIECNKMVWDMLAGEFCIPGPYVLTQNQNRYYGKTLRVDTCLHAVQSHYINTSQNGEDLWIAANTQFP